MNKLNYLLFFMLLSASFLLISQTLSFDPNTGDEQFDDQLNQLNSIANNDLDQFEKNVSEKYHVSTHKVTEMLSIMEPVEVLVSFETASLTEEPIDIVIESYRKNKFSGWRLIVRELGIKGNSREFAELKKSFLQTNFFEPQNTLSKK